MQVKIRKATEADSEKMWQLMHDLAVFEKYIGAFAITPEIVRESGFRKSPPDFLSFVAVEGNDIVGLLVYYFLPYTASNRSAIYMKELIVAESHRGQKIGEQLMHALKEEALTHNCTDIKWFVAPWNDAGKKFYERLGAKEDTEWIPYNWKL